MKRVIVATDRLGRARVVGPVHTDESLAKLAAELEAAGWRIEHGDVAATSAAEFRAERSRGALSCR